QGARNPFQVLSGCEPAVKPISDEFDKRACPAGDNRGAEHERLHQYSALSGPAVKVPYAEALGVALVDLFAGKRAAAHDVDPVEISANQFIFQHILRKRALRCDHEIQLKFAGQRILHESHILVKTVRPADAADIRKVLAHGTLE